MLKTWVGLGGYSQPDLGTNNQVKAAT